MSIILDSKILIPEDRVNERAYPIKKDFDGLLHINYLCTLIPTDDEMLMNIYIRQVSRHRDYIVKNINDAKSAKIAAKYHWMKTYHNWFCSGYEIFKKYLID